ncbi:MAG TPA: decaprenyl-phosphate phosphoribosyltransferase, partial [Spirochaetota bacterium]|nr:decaprenyl-phosphate phosphoribosyltransferase [Spirochaetota bacterium]
IKIKHWIKNIFFIYAPLVFSLQLLNLQKLFDATMAFISFSFVSVFVYILNDIKDKDSDARHPVKSKRPIASGKISTTKAFIIGAVFLIFGIFVSLFLGLDATIILLIYVITNVFYSYILKRIVVIDVFIIAFGFFLRVLLGSVAIGVNLSHWMALATFALSLFLGFCKRRNEINILGEEAVNCRTNLKDYTVQVLDIFIIISASVAVMSYALYSMDREVVEKLGVDNLIYSFPFVIYGVFRYLYLVYCKNMGANPEDIAVKDVGIVTAVILWAVLIVFLIYFKDCDIGFDFRFNLFSYFKR